jgi:Zn-dependent metalloprotease/predicted secreted protein
MSVREKLINLICLFVLFSFSMDTDDTHAFRALDSGKNESSISSGRSLTELSKPLSPSRPATAAQRRVLEAYPNLTVHWNRDQGIPYFVRGFKRPLNGDSVHAAFDFLDEIKGAFRMQDPRSEFRLRMHQPDELGHEHIRLRQYHQGIPVVGSEMIVHINDKREIYLVNGHYTPDIDISLSPSLTASQALQVGLDDFADKLTLRVVQGPDLVIYPVGNRHYLAYRYSLYYNEAGGVALWIHYVDAQSGALLDRYNDIKFIDPPTDNGSPASMSGQKLQGEGGGNVVVPGWRDYTNNAYYLWNNELWWFIRNDAESGYPDAGTYAHRTTSNWGSSDRAEISAAMNFYFTQRYFSRIHGRDSFDNDSGYVQAYVHVIHAYCPNNAWWDSVSRWFAFCDGDGENYGPFPTLDIVAHEFSHAWTSHTSDLNYTNESGALNESFSDIMGANVEFYAQEDGRRYYPNAEPGMADWLLGEDSKKNAIAIRDMRNPSNTATVGEGRESPSRYHGRFWVSDNDDNGGVHTNSGVQNSFYYLLSEGGAGWNDGIPYQVTGIKTNNARRIAYHVNNYYLTESDSFRTVRWYWVVAAEALFLPGYPSRVEAVKTAWDAVGIREVPDFDPIESFEGSGLPVGFSSGGDAAWFITTDDKTHGNQSIRAGAIGDNQRTWLQWQVSLPQASPISFSVRTATERSFLGGDGDALKFYIDGTERATWKGFFPWTFYSDHLSAGSHILTWEYVKDTEHAEGADTVWIDEIYLPEVFVLTSFAINNGAPSTDSRWVTLNHGVTGDPTHTMASESSTFSGATWQPYESAPKFILSSGSGSKTVYFKARKADGEMTQVMSDSIEYSMTITPVIVNGISAEGNLKFENDYDWYQFSLSSSGVYIIESVASTLQNSFIYLYGPGNMTDLIAVDDNSGVGNMAKVVRYLSAGTYYVMVKGFGTGTYELSVRSPAPLSVNADPVIGLISCTEDEDFYQFNVTTPGPFSIDTAAYTLTNNILTLYGPEGFTWVASDDDGGIGKMARITKFLATGNYTIKIQGKPSNATGSYFIGVRTMPVLIPDTPGATANIGGLDDYHYYQFTISSPNVYIIETRPGTLSNTFMYLYGPDSMTTRIATDEDSGVGRMAKMVKVLPAGTYYVMIKGYATGTYTIDIKTPQPLGIDGSSTSAEIDPGENEDWYQFTVTSPNLYRIATASGETSPITGDRLSLYGPNGLGLISNATQSGEGELATLTPYLTAGTYYVHVRSLIQGATGTYTISVPPLATGISTNGSPVSGSIVEWNGEDWYIFTAPSRNAYIMETLAGTLADTVITLYGPNGLTLLTSDDNSGIGNMAKVVRYLNQGVYLLKVDARYPDETGTYSLRITTPTPLVVDDPMAFGQIDPAEDEDWYRFDVVSRETHMIAALPVTLPTLLLSLYGPNALKSVGSDTGTGPDDLAAIAKTPAPGTYFIKVKNGSKTIPGTGTYQVGVRTGSAWLVVSPSTLDFGSELKEATFTLYNRGRGELQWTISGRMSPWFSITPASGTLLPQGKKAVTVTVDRSKLSPGEYDHTITISSNGGNETVDVTMTVQGAVSGWAKIYSGPSDGTEQPADIRQTSDNGFIVAGNTSSFGAGNTDYWVMKLSSTGTVEWEKTYGGPLEDKAYAIEKTIDGGYIVAGESRSFKTGDSGSDIWILKLHSDGTVDWEKNYGGTGTEHVKSVITTVDAQGNPNGYLVIGSTYSFGAGATDIWLLKLRTDGTVEWERTYGGSNYEFGRSGQQTPDKGYIVVGDTQSFGAGGRDVWVLKLTSDGAIEWQKTYGGTGTEMPFSIELATDSGFVVGSYTTSSGSGGYDMWIIKLDESGTVVWQKAYGGTGNDYLNSLAKTTDGGYIATGWSYSFGTLEESNDVWVIKINGSGMIGWQRRYHRESDWGYVIRETLDGGYIVAGQTDWLVENGNGDVWIMKLVDDGSLGCSIDTATEGIATDTTLTSTNTETAITISAAAAPDTSSTVTNSSALVSGQCGTLQD